MKGWRMICMLLNVLPCLLKVVFEVFFFHYTYLYLRQSLEQDYNNFRSNI